MDRFYFFLFMISLNTVPRISAIIWVSIAMHLYTRYNDRSRFPSAEQARFSIKSRASSESSPETHTFSLRGPASNLWTFEVWFVFRERDFTELLAKHVDFIQEQVDRSRRKHWLLADLLEKLEGIVKPVLKLIPFDASHSAIYTVTMSSYMTWSYSEIAKQKNMASIPSYCNAHFLLSILSPPMSNNLKRRV